MYRIGQFSKLTKTTIKTLHYYDEIGILKPEHIDEFTGYRFYTTRQLVELHKIQSYRQIGLSINEIVIILKGGDISKILEARKAELEDEIANCTEKLSRIEFILCDKQEDYFMNYQATIKELPQCIVYCKKLKVKSYDDYFSIIPAIGQECMKANPGLKCSIPEYCFIVYLDGEYKEKDFNIEFCEAVEKFGNETESIKFKEILSTEAVSVMHKGPYSELSKAYAYAYSWIEDNGYISSDNPRESYIDGIWNKESEEEWLTEIQIPIKKK